MGVPVYRMSLAISCVVVVTGCATPAAVRESAEFTHTQLGVLQGQVQRHFRQARASLDRQKTILEDQFGTNLRLTTATTTIVELESAADSDAKTVFNALKRDADAVRTAEAGAEKARREYQQELDAVKAAEGPTAASFGAVMTPLQALSEERARRDRLSFFAAYLESVAKELETLRKAEVGSGEE